MPTNTVTPPSTPVDTTPPTVSIINPVANQTVSGTITVAANAADDTAVTSMQFVLYGQPLGTAIAAAPYAISWNTAAVPNGSATLTAVAADIAHLTTTSSPVVVTVQNPAPPMICFVLQAQATAHGLTAVSTASFHTAIAGEVLVAFVSADGPQSGGQSATVSGAGLAWKLVQRANGQGGDAEIWEAPAPAILTSASVTSTLARPGYGQDLTVIAMEGVKGIGASVAGSSSSSAPSINLTTTAAKSLVFSVGRDWDNAIARTLPAGWVTLEQWLNASTGDTSWSQYTNAPTGTVGTAVSVGDVAPTTDRWDLAAVELLNDGV